MRVAKEAQERKRLYEMWKKEVYEAWPWIEDNVLKNTTGYSQKLKAYLNIISVLNHVMRVAANIILLTFIEKNMRKY